MLHPAILRRRRAGGISGPSGDAILLETGDYMKSEADSYVLLQALIWALVTSGGAAVTVSSEIVTAQI